MNTEPSPATLLEALTSLDSRIPDLVDRLRLSQVSLKPKFQMIAKRPSGTQNSHLLSQATQRTGENQYALRRSLPKELVLATIASNMYKSGSIVSTIQTASWTRAHSITRSIQAMLFLLEQGLLEPAMLQARGALELIASLSLIQQEAQLVCEKPDDPESVSAWLVAIEASISQRAKGTRLDWKKLLASDMAKGKAKSYKPEEDRLDYTATDLMNSIDELGKRVKGCRKIYEFLCEFAHPNISHYFVGLDKTSTEKTNAGIVIYTKEYGDKGLGLPFLGDLNTKIGDVFAILDEALAYAKKAVDVLDERQRAVHQGAQLWIKLNLKMYPEAIFVSDPCPCFSGKIASACCGRNRKLRR